MKVVIYARFTNKNSAEESIEMQLRSCHKFAKENNYTVVGEYIDRSPSGLSDGCPEFQRLIADSAKKQFQAVLVYRIDRLSRGSYDYGIYNAQLKVCGVKVLSVCEHSQNDSCEILLEEMLKSITKMYSDKLSYKIRQGQKENALNCKTNGGIPLFGYCTNTEQHYEIDPLAATVVLEIFTRYADGQPVGAICKDINSRYVFGKTKCKQFTTEYIYSLIKNRRFMGEYRFGDVVIPNGMPAIVSEELFNKVQDRLKNHQNRKEDESNEKE